MKPFSKERLEAIRFILCRYNESFEVVSIHGMWSLRGGVTGKIYINENEVGDIGTDTQTNQYVRNAIKDTEPKVEKEMNTSTVIDTTKKDATDIAKAIAKRIAAEKLLIAAGVPLEGLLKKMGLNPELARSPLAPAIVAVIGLLVTNSIQDLPKKQLVHELCSLYLEQSAVNLLSPILGDLVTTFTQAIESVE